MEADLSKPTSFPRGRERVGRRPGLEGDADREGTFQSLEGGLPPRSAMILTGPGFEAGSVRRWLGEEVKGVSGWSTSALKEKTSGLVAGSEFDGG